MQIKETELELFDSVESLLEKIQSQPLDEDVLVCLLKIHNPALLTKEKSFDLKIWGKTLTDWTKLAFKNAEIIEIETDMSFDILSLIKPHLKKQKWTAVFYADTPLLERKTFLSILDYAKTKNLSAIKLERGYVFKTEDIKNIDSACFDKPSFDFGDNFLTIFNLEQFEKATQILKNRILSFHQQNGVLIMDKNTTFVDGDVEIEKNVVIEPNVTILGNTKICEGAHIGSFCYIKNSTIGKNAQMTFCHIENAKIKDGEKLKPFTDKNGDKK